MNKEEWSYFFAITIIMAGFLVGISYFGQGMSESSITGNIVATNEAPAIESTGITCAANCLNKGCSDPATEYLGYNINICKCLNCRDQTEKNYYCHAGISNDLNLRCDWQRA